MTGIKLGKSYLSKEELKDVIQLIAKERNIKNYKSKSNNNYTKLLKNNLKIKKE